MREPGRSVAVHLPNAVSLFRSLLVVPIAYYTVSAADGPAPVALALLVAAWASDGLDGWLARRLDACSQLGRILDPLADKLVVGGTAVALAVSRGMPIWLVAVILARDAAILGSGAVLWRRVGSVPQSDTVGRVTLGVLMLTLVAYMANVRAWAGIMTWVALGAVVASSLSYGLRMEHHIRTRQGRGAPIAQSG